MTGGRPAEFLHFAEEMAASVSDRPAANRDRLLAGDLLQGGVLRLADGETGGYSGRVCGQNTGRNRRSRTGGATGASPL